MERRRLQLANSHDGGGDSLFPITLVQGDNGQKGIDLYNYVVENATYDGTRLKYYFKENESVVAILPSGNEKRITSFVVNQDMIIYPGVYVVVVYSNGEVNIRFLD
jgi:hypothetical protein